jgi:hypothetical protein
MAFAVMDLRYSRDELRFSGVEDFSRYRENRSHSPCQTALWKQGKGRCVRGPRRHGGADRSAAYGGDMTSMKWMRRAALAATFALALSLAAPAQAAGWTAGSPGPGLFQKAWQWIAELWASPERGGQPMRNLSKAGVCIDPLGSPCNSSPSTGNTRGNAGDGSDPRN